MLLPRLHEVVDKTAVLMFCRRTSGPQKTRNPFSHKKKQFPTSASKQTCHRSVRAAIKFTSPRGFSAFFNKWRFASETSQHAQNHVQRNLATIQQMHSSRAGRQARLGVFTRAAHHQKRQWFLSPMQVPITLQWWSNVATHSPHSRQWCDRRGTCIKPFTFTRRSNRAGYASAAMCVSFGLQLVQAVCVECLTRFVFQCVRVRPEAAPTFQ